jgi:putative ABC transport system permease protein
MTWLLVAVCVALLVIMALGIVGLASFWVQQRVRTIGIRRALGARRGHVLAWFQAENALLTALGVALGMAGAWGINLALMGRYEVPALPIAYLPVGALVLLVLGQLAVLGPARRAAALPPVVVMRQA